jgi:hypothetical protein
MFDKQEGYLMRIKKTIVIFIGITFFMAAGYSNQSSAEVNVNIGIGVPLPQVVIHSPPPVVVIPGTYAYFAPDVGVEIFFYHGYWYRPHHGYWYRARGYNGPWGHVKNSGVPHVLRGLPPDFRHNVQHSERIRYTDFKQNWKTWEQKKHWDKHGYRQDVGDKRDNGKRKSNYNNHGGKGKHKR